MKTIQLIIDFLGKTFPDLRGKVVLQLIDLVHPELLRRREEGFEVDLVLDAFNVEAVGGRDEANGCSHSGLLVTVTPAQGPVEDADVVTESWPHESTGRSSPEPVDHEDFGKVEGRLVAKGQPVSKVVAEVVSEERSHGERIVHDLETKSFHNKVDTLYN